MAQYIFVNIARSKVDTNSQYSKTSKVKKKSTNNTTKRLRSRLSMEYIICRAVS